MKVRDCNLRKVIECRDSDSVLSVARKLKRFKNRHIFVVKSGNPVGIVSTTDINNRLVAMGKDSKKTKASDIMTKKLMVKDPDDDLVPVYLEMLKRKIYSCPVVQKGKLKGVLDMKEVMNRIVRAKSGGF